MSNTTETVNVLACEVRLDESGQGFVLDVAADSQAQVRLHFPLLMGHYLMRVLPLIDAAQHLGTGPEGNALIAYPVKNWTVESVLQLHGVALHVVDERHVEAAFVLSTQDASQFHCELGAAINRSLCSKALTTTSEVPRP